MSDQVMTQEQLSVPYNPNILVTYKYIPETYAAPDSPTFRTDKVAQIEWDLHEGRRNAVTAAEHRSNISWLEDQIAEWYDSSYEKEDVLKQLIEKFEVNPTREMDVYGTASFSGSIRIPVDQLEDFDLSNVTIDVEVSSYEYDSNLIVDDVSIEEI